MRRGTALVGVVVAAIASLGGCPGDCRCRITTEQLPVAVVGQSYSARVEARVSCSYDLSDTTDTPANPDWTIIAGAPPTGLRLSRDGQLTGTPTTAGAFRFTVQADCSAGLRQDKPTKDFEINAAP